jgi:heme/copper-type cytochrome/quinol oxidase subunit 2
MDSFGAMALSPENRQSTLSIQNILIVSVVALSVALMFAGLIYNHKKRQSKCEK